VALQIFRSFSGGAITKFCWETVDRKVHPPESYLGHPWRVKSPGKMKGESIHPESPWWVLDRSTYPTVEKVIC